MGKIVFWRTLANAYRLTFADLGRLVNLAEPWMTAQIAIYAIAAGLTLFAGPAFALGFLFVAGLPLLAGGFAAFAVGWQRTILFGPPSTAAHSFHFGPREWRMLGYGLGIGLIAWGVMIVGAALLSTVLTILVIAEGGSGPELPRPLVATTTVLMMLVGGFCFCRLSLVFPAIAADEPGPLLRSAFKRGRTSALQLAFGPMLGTLSMWLPALGYALLAEYIAGDDALLLRLLLIPLVPMNYLQIAVPLAFVALAYRQLVGAKA